MGQASVAPKIMETGDEQDDANALTLRIPRYEWTVSTRRGAPAAER